MSMRSKLTCAGSWLSPVAESPTEMVEMPVEVFSHRLETQLVKHVRPPTRRDLGTKVTKLKPVFTCAPVLEKMLSVARGLPRGPVLRQ